MKEKKYNQKVKPSNFKFKPEKYAHYLSLRELALYVERDPSRILKMERAGKINPPARIKRGELSIRLYSPEQAEEIKKFFATVKRGRKPYVF